MRKQSNPVTASRRRFLKGLAAAGSVATVATIAKVGGVNAQEEAMEAVPQSEKTGYHLTPHIREYYEKARI